MKTDGFWKCENCSTEYEDQDMNNDSVCEVCSDEDDTHHCVWIDC